MPVSALPSRASPRRQCLCTHCSFEHAARALPRVQRRPPTLLALGLEEPFPFRPTADVLCRLVGTNAMTPTSCQLPHRSRVIHAYAMNPLRRGRFTHSARTALALPGLGGVPPSAQNASSRTGARRGSSTGQLTSFKRISPETRFLHTRSPDYLREASSKAPRCPPS